MHPYIGIRSHGQQRYMVLTLGAHLATNGVWNWPVHWGSDLAILGTILMVVSILFSIVMAEKYVVEGILRSRELTSGEEEFLIRWAENYKPSWQSARIIEEDCPQLVAEFRKVSCASFTEYQA